MKTPKLNTRNFQVVNPKDLPELDMYHNYTRNLIAQSLSDYEASFNVIKTTHVPEISNNNLYWTS